MEILATSMPAADGPSDGERASVSPLKAQQLHHHHHQDSNDFGFDHVANVLLLLQSATLLL